MTPTPPAPSPRLTREQVRRVDAICTDDFGIPGIVLMENAARAIADVALRLLAGAPGNRVLIICGGGNNGGDGYAAARHLHNSGCHVLLAAATPGDALIGDAATNAGIARRMGLQIEPATPELVRSAPADLLIDALLGTGIDQPPREAAAALILAMNARRQPLLAVDIPSGLDCDTGRPLGPAEHCIRATATVTMVAEKSGFPAARNFTGDIIIGDIGAPPAAIRRAMLAQ